MTDIDSKLNHTLYTSSAEASEIWSKYAKFGFCAGGKQKCKTQHIKIISGENSATMAGTAY